MRTCFIVLGLFLLTIPSFAQIRLKGEKADLIDSSLYEKLWKAQWISVPNEPINVYGIYHFRKTIEMPDVPDKYVVHVSADNRYKLYVNEVLVSLGPARGDIYNWSFETVDIAPYLKKGKNILAAVVWNYAEQKPVAQMSLNQTGFILQGNTQAEYAVNTDSSWLCYKNLAYKAWMKPVDGYYAAGPGEYVEAAKYPWGWETLSYDDSNWVKAKAGRNGAMKGSRDYPEHLLVPRPIPAMEMTPERLAVTRISEGINCPTSFPSKKQDLVIPANTQVHLLLDNERLTTGYLTLLFSKGKDADIALSYAEALVGKDGKQNRSEVDGKKFIGYQDRIVADGGMNRNFTTLWWRTWRYIDVNISTADEPLVLNDIYGTFSAYPFENAATFSAQGHDELTKMLEIGWRTARLCANETYMDCPYYEQLQYFGDTRIQTMISLYNTSDPYMVKNALEQGRQSMVADGITMSRYPSSTQQFISSFSLWWIGIGYDYWMYRGDEAYMKTLLPAHRNILSWYEQFLKPDYSLNYIPYWFFADWAAGFPGGEPIREKEGNSSLQDLIYLLTLEEAAKMENSFGIKEMAVHYNNIAKEVRKSFNAKYWDESRQLFADTYKHDSYSQHVNSLAVLAEMVTGDQAAELMKRTLADETLIQATIYFRYYVHKALAKAGLGNDYLDNLQIWRDQMALGLTTWAEEPEPTRSDCHAWGASPNIELYRIVLGIDSNASGFSDIIIKPSLCGLTDVSGSIPHPNGTVAVSYHLDKKGALQAVISIPEKTKGTFVWKGKNYTLTTGEQTLKID